MSLRPIQTSFTAGEISDEAHARQDLEEYYKGAKTLENVIVRPVGGLVRRGSLRYVGPAYSHDYKSYLVPFEYSVNAAYVVEISGDGYMQFYRNKALIVGAEIAHPWTEAQLAEVQWVHIGDVAIFFHGDVPTQKLTRVTETSFTLTAIDWEWGPFTGSSSYWRTPKTITLTPSGVSGSITLTASATLFTPASDWINTYVYVANDAGTTEGYCYITAVTDATHATATVKSTTFPPASVAYSKWMEWAWGPRYGYPRTATFHQERLWIGGNAYEPNTVWGSVTSEPWNMAAGTDDNMAVTYPLAAEQMDEIVWMLSLNSGIFAGTASDIFRLSGGGFGTALTPTNVYANRLTNDDAGTPQGKVVGARALFVPPAADQLMELEFNLSDDKVTPVDLTFLASHAYEGGVTALAWAGGKTKVLWAVRADGQLVGLTYDPEHKVRAFHRHITDGVVESIAVITYEKKPQLWAVIQRGAKRFIEILENDEGYADSAVWYSGTETDTITGLSHLESETVAVYTNKGVHPDCVVSGGQVVLEFEVTSAVVGLPFTSRIQTLPVDVMRFPLHTVMTERRAWREVWLRLKESAPPLVDGEELPGYTGSFIGGAPPGLITGSVQYFLATGGFDYEGVITIEHSKPLPLQILGFFGVLELGG